jgi:hypothetical protein
MTSRIAVASLLTIVSCAISGGGLALARPAKPVGGPAVQGTDVPISVEDVARESDRNVLQINNQSPFIVILYVGDVRVGFIHPYRSAFIRGLLAGYHKLYAHSQYGTTSWGPRDTWVPGSWNLTY